MKLSKAWILAAVMLIVPAAAEARGGGHGGSHSSHLGGTTRDHYTHGYYRRDGTYVHGYRATDPNSTRDDNYSTRGNTNPYTGEPGTKPRDEDPH